MLSPSKILIILPLVLVSIFLPLSQALTNSESPAQKRSATCPGFGGNSDLYGLGIRLGVYLQWISAWFANTVHPAAAGANHSANSIFLLAILIAVTVAVSANAIQPVEAYIMVMICFGFVLTVLSVFGIRIFLLNPASLTLFMRSLQVEGKKLVVESISRKVDGLLDAWRGLFRQTALTEPSNAQRTSSKRHKYSGVLWSMIRTVSVASYRHTLPIRLKELDFLRHPSLSWSGVVWRTATLSYLTGFSMWLWWSSWIPGHDMDGAELCVSSVYFFGPRTLSSGLINFYKVTTTIVGVFVLYMAVFILPRVTIVLDELMYNTIVVLGLGDRTIAGKYRMPLLQLKNFIDQLGDAFRQYSVIIAALVADPKDRPDIKAMLRSFMGRDEDSERIATIIDNGENLMPYATHFCVSFHVFILITMSCFIAFIEKTVIVANITGVYTIKSTGQLIPFIIGVVSSVRTFIEVIVLSWFNHQRNPPKKSFSTADNVETGVIRGQEDDQTYQLKGFLASSFR